MSENVAMSRKQIGGEVPMVANEITDSCIYSGLFGSIDSARMNAIAERIISMSEERQIDLTIIDLSNVDAIDSAVSGHLLRLAETLRLVGVTPIFCGIRSNIAASMASTGVDFGQTHVVRDLKRALKLSLEMSGFTIIQAKK
ncbi:Sulfate transporter/antisigma-factor antagonist STAS [Pseudoalteromonas luteoviolacea B = ATCC 29581]|nr:Sulfate transporter/antisigma-factor antagonist STAS [Pseudoalteromonas luteoviolacea B = ATCC 29581]